MGAIAHLFDEDAFGSVLTSDEVTPNDLRGARLGAFIAIAELFTYLNEDKPAPPSAIASQYSRTLAFAVARSKIIWPQVGSHVIASRWRQVRSIAGWAEPPVRSADLFAALEIWFSDGDRPEWSVRLLREREVTSASDFAAVAASAVSDQFGLSLPTLPPSFDGRFEWLSMVTTRLRAAVQEKRQAEMALGLLLAALEPGELMHLNWLRAHLPALPLSAIHYAGWSATLSNAKEGKGDVFNGLGRRLMRELLRPTRFQDPPWEDISWADLMAAGDNLDEARIRSSGRNLSVALVPGVVVGGALQRSEQAPVASRDTKERIPSKLPERQPNLFEDSGGSQELALQMRHLNARVEELSRMMSNLTKDRTVRKPKAKQT